MEPGQTELTVDLRFELQGDFWVCSVRVGLKKPIVLGTLAKGAARHLELRAAFERLMHQAFETTIRTAMPSATIGGKVRMPLS